MRVDCEEVEDDEYLILHQGEPFTGEVVERREDGSLITLYTYDTGNADGPYKEWYPDQRLYKEGMMRLGLPVGLHRRWYPDGRLAEESSFSDQNVEIMHRTFDREGNLLSDGSAEHSP